MQCWPWGEQPVHRNHNFPGLAPQGIAGPWETSCGRMGCSFPGLAPQGMPNLGQAICRRGGCSSPSLVPQGLFSPGEASCQRVGCFPGLAWSGEAIHVRVGTDPPGLQALGRPVVEEEV